MNWLSLLQTLLPLLTVTCLAAATAQGALRVARPRLGADGGRAEPWDKKATRDAGLLMTAVCAACAAFFVLVALDRNVGYDKTLEEALHSVFPTSIDADHYLKLAEFGYGGGLTAPEFEEQHLMIVFFPLFPLLVRAVHALTGLGYYTAGLLVQPFLFGVGCAALYRLVQPRFGRETANWTLALLCLLPGSFFFAAPMTESLYLALTMLAFVCLDEDRPLGFALLGFGAALTRSTGGLLAGVAGVVWVMRLAENRRAARPVLQAAGAAPAALGADAPSDVPPPRQGPEHLRVRNRKAAPWLAAALGPAAGTGCYLLLNLYYYGDLFAFADAQKSHWNQGLGWAWETVRYMLGYVFGWWQSNRNFAVYIALLAVVLILAQTVVLAACGRTLPVPWLAYGVAYVTVADGATWLLSCARYSLSLPFFPLGLALCCKKQWQRVALALVLGVVWLLYLRKYLTNGPIY